MSTYSKYEIEKLNKLGVKAKEGIDYSTEEIKTFETNAMDYIMSQSTKNISDLLLEYRGILNKMIKYN